MGSSRQTNRVYDSEEGGREEILATVVEGGGQTALVGC
jgi:hypothetical protein